MAIRMNGPIESLPNILSFKFDPERGPGLNTWMIKPYRDWGVYEEAIKIFSKNAGTGAAVGVGTAVGGAALIDQMTNQFQLTKKIKESVAAGLTIGGLLGALRGAILIQKFKLDQPDVIKETFGSSAKAKRIIEAFVSSHLDSLENIEGITCPITYEVMVYPVSICKASHTFEYFSILRALGTKPEKKMSSLQSSCPDQKFYIRSC